MIHYNTLIIFHIFSSYFMRNALLIKRFTAKYKHKIGTSSNLYFLLTDYVDNFLLLFLWQTIYPLRYFTASCLKFCIHIWLVFLNDCFFRNGQSFLFVMTIKEKNDTNKTLRIFSIKKIKILIFFYHLKKCKDFVSEKSNKNSAPFYCF